MTIQPATPESFSRAIDLLEKNNLPVSDITPGLQMFVMEEGEQLAGTIAVEYNFDHALLRSLCVDTTMRNQGIGETLVDFIEDYVRKQGVTDMFLLTTTARNFFEKRNYSVISREEIPEFIRQTSEFASVCPASATVMKKKLS